MSDRATEARLALCDPDAVPRFKSCLARALSFGIDAYIERDPWRTAEQQAEKVRAGLSQVQDSAHCHTREVCDCGPTWHIAHAIHKDGSKVTRVPASRAIHLISRAHFYFALKPELLPAFAVRVGKAAIKEGLRWGGLYGPKDRDPAKAEEWDLIFALLMLALTDERFSAAESAFIEGRKIGACWDPLHIEWRPA